MTENEERFTDAFCMSVKPFTTIPGFLKGATVHDQKCPYVH
jgi:hypothetical protein